VKVNDGPVQTLKSGELFYEPPNALHAISRNASMAQPLKYLVIQVSDPTKPATVPTRQRTYCDPSKKSCLDRAGRPLS
jgi:quercetin dioxygenase-like cupin family protein